MTLLFTLSTDPMLTYPPGISRCSFGGAITTVVIPDTHRAFCFDVTFLLDHPVLVSLRDHKPPMHFHPYQEEYIKVLEGALVVEVERRKIILTPQDGKLCISPWTNHCLYPPPASKEETNTSPASNITRILLSGQHTSETFNLDLMFFQNWYGYQDEVFLGHRKMDIIQVMNVSVAGIHSLFYPIILPLVPRLVTKHVPKMFDAGGSYLSFPEWIPCSTKIARLIGILVGRWLGGLLGYRPFHRQWTADWQLAQQKMETSIFFGVSMRGSRSKAAV